MSDFTDLERKVLARICDEQSDIAKPLRDLLAGAGVTDRYNTGHGFFTSFEVPQDVAPLAWPSRMVDGPNGEIAVGEAILLMGFVLWLEDGYPDCLEGFQYGTPAGDDIDLKRFDLAAIRWVKPAF